ncbi:rhodanese-like domain-containing protein [Streptomyces acidiscabies]|uniref:Transporter n=1 Tax=Streptomyces acidiscabies TaxID=42234 RepID=A0A0L0K628_9ACTN|nr:rhodanese-like domain-containing protein [Streptomyces acidiscabies]KND33134.1 transporter [Streptomyces acidiscabies]
MSITEAATTVLNPAEAYARLGDFAVVDVRTPGEYAGGHVPGALNIPLDHLAETLPDLREAASSGALLIVCASGNRSSQACDLLAEHGIPAVNLAGGTTAWVAQGHPLSESDGRRTWSMERQVRFTAGATVLAGLALGAVTHRSFRLLSAGIASGLVFSAVTDTCGMAAVLAKLPHNRPAGADLDAARAALRTRTR